MLHRQLLFLLLWVLPEIGSSQQTEIVPVAFITESDGLEEKDNRFLYKDSEGYTWISSIQGLYRYDGKSLKHYSPDPRDSSSIKGYIVNGYFFEDTHRNIWFSTHDAINCYIRAKDDFQSFTMPGNPGPGYFTGGLDSLGQLWFIWDTLLMTFQINTHQFTRISPIESGASRLQVTMDQSGTVTHAYIYNTERDQPGFEIIDFNHQVPIRNRSYFKQVDTYPLVIRNLFIENDTSLWIASHYGLVHFNPESRDTMLYSPNKKNERIFFNYVIGMNDSLLFVSSYGQGAFIFNQRTHTFVNHYQLEFNGIPVSEPLQTVYKDRTGGVWISIMGKGVAYFHPQNILFRFYRHTLTTTRSSSGINLNSMIELSDHTVFASSNLHGAVNLQGPGKINKQYQLGATPGWLANNTSSSYLDSKGRIWVLTANGPCILFPDDVVRPLKEKGNIYVNGICETQDGEIVIAGSNGGLYKCLDKGNRQFVTEAIPNADTSKVYTRLYCHSDHLLYGTADLTSLDIYDPQNEYKLVRSIPLPANTYAMVSMNEGNEIWIGTNKGIFYFMPKTGQLSSYPWMDFLHGTIVYGIIPQDQTHVWLSTNHGIFRLDLVHETYHRFDARYGTGATNFNANSMLHASNGEIWLGSQDGITIIDPAIDIVLTKPNSLHFSKILINDTESPGLVCSLTGATNIAEIKNINLPFLENTLSFEFSAFDYTGPDHLVYNYKMNGVDTAWVQSGNHGFARYANLDPGNYVFDVRADNGNPGGYSPVHSLAIHIIAPVYRRTWFIMMLILLVGASLFWVYRFNERRKRKILQLVFEKKLALESERLRIANDMHDDLGSGLSALGLRTKFLTEQVEEPVLRKQMDELVGNTDKLTQQIRETIWTINTANDTIDNLVTRLHQYTLDYLEGSGIGCAVKLMPEQVTSSIPGPHRRELYLAYKEALHNIYKHAHATEVSVSMGMDLQRHLIILIQDNGKGFDMQSPNTGMGLQSMQKRMQEIGGQFSITSDSHGTQVTLTYPV